MSASIDSAVLDRLVGYLRARVASGELRREELRPLATMLAADFAVPLEIVHRAIEQVGPNSTDPTPVEQHDVDVFLSKLRSILSATSDPTFPMELQGLRRAVYRHVVRVAVQHANTTDRDTLSRLAARFFETTPHEPMRLLVADVGFHRHLAIAGSAAPYHLVSNALHAEMLNHTAPLLRIYPSKEAVVEYHRRLIAALEAGDEGAALRALDYYFTVHRIVEPVRSRRRSATATGTASPRPTERKRPVQKAHAAPAEGPNMTTKQQPIQEIIARIRSGLDELEAALPTMLDEVLWAQQTRAALGKLLPSVELPTPSRRPMAARKAAPEAEREPKRHATVKTDAKAKSRQAKDAAPKTITPEQVLDAVRSLPTGPNVSEIASALQVPTDMVKPIVRALREANQLRIQGEKRAMRYFAIEQDVAKAS